MTKLKHGDAVVIVARDQAPQDVKSGLYFPHYANLRGTILKLYGEEASVVVDRDSLPVEVRARHEEGEKAMRQRWLDNLSEEGRGRLSDREKQFSLNYAVLISVADLVPARGGARRAEPVPVEGRLSPEDKQQAKAVGRAAQAIDPLSGESNVQRANRKADQAGESGTESATKRLSALELDAAEEAFLEQRRGQNGNENKGRSPRPT